MVVQESNVNGIAVDRQGGEWGPVQALRGG